MDPELHCFAKSVKKAGQACINKRYCYVIGFRRHNPKGVVQEKLVCTPRMYSGSLKLNRKHCVLFVVYRVHLTFIFSNSLSVVQNAASERYFVNIIRHIPHKQVQRVSRYFPGYINLNENVCLNPSPAIKIKYLIPETNKGS